MKKKVLLIGGSGNLGQAIKKLKIFKNCLSPSKESLNLLRTASIRKYLNKDFDLIINCAALARMKICEEKPDLAKKINITGVLNLVKELKKYSLEKKKRPKLIHISTDGVYPSISGNYKESSQTKPYNIYGWSKLSSEKIIKKYTNFVIIRTRFFDKNNIRFKTAAKDIYTSMMEIRDLARKIFWLGNINFRGVINIGSTKKSDFTNYKKYKKNIKPCKREDIIKNLKFNIAKDASLNLEKFIKLKKKWKRSSL